MRLQQTNKNVTDRAHDFLSYFELLSSCCFFTFKSFVLNGVPVPFIDYPFKRSGGLGFESR